MRCSDKCAAAGTPLRTASGHPRAPPSPAAALQRAGPGSPGRGSAEAGAKPTTCRPSWVSISGSPKGPTPCPLPLLLVGLSPTLGGAPEIIFLRLGSSKDLSQPSLPLVGRGSLTTPLATLTKEQRLPHLPPPHAAPFCCLPFAFIPQRVVSKVQPQRRSGSSPEEQRGEEAGSS